LVGGLPDQLFAYRYGSALAGGGEVCSEQFGGLIEGNYGPPILQNDRRKDDEASKKYLVRSTFAALEACPAME
jgi:hypothetical protein